MENYSVLQGTALNIDVTLRDSDDAAITTYDGTQPLTTTVWPGGARALALNATTVWVTPSLGSIQVQLPALQTANMAPGRYQLVTILTDGSTPVEAYGCTIDVRPMAGIAVAPKVYTTYNDLLLYGRAALKKLQTDDDEAGFAEQQGLARDWLDGLIMSRWQTSGSMTLGSPGYGAALVGQNASVMPSKYLRDLLNADALVVRPLVVKVCALKALASVFGGQVGVGEGGLEYRTLARHFDHEADQLVKTLMAEIDSNGDGVADFAVNLGNTSIR